MQMTKGCLRVQHFVTLTSISCEKQGRPEGFRVFSGKLVELSNYVISPGLDPRPFSVGATPVVFQQGHVLEGQGHP